MGDSWRLHGVHKWIAYDRGSGEVVGRGGLSRTPVDDDWGQIYAFLPDEPWVRVAHEVSRPFVAHTNWLEIGWALRREFWGRGYAAEIGHAGLAYAFNVLGAHAVVSCTVRHNARSRAVMERIGMRYAGEIRSRGLVDGVEGERDDAPFAVCVLLRKDWNHRSAASGVSSSAAGGAVDLPSGPRLSRWLAGRLGVVSAGGDLTAAVVAQWRRAGPALAQVRRDVLRRLTDAEALARRDVVANPLLQIYPGRAMTCVFDPAKALRQLHPPAVTMRRTPDQADCRPNCQNISYTDRDIADIRNRLAELQDLTADHLPPSPRWQRHRAERDRLAAIIRQHGHRS